MGSAFNQMGCTRGGRGGKVWVSRLRDESERRMLTGEELGKVSEVSPLPELQNISECLIGYCLDAQTRDAAKTNSTNLADLFA